MKRTLERLGAKNTEIHIADASEYRLEWKEAFDVVLVDVPAVLLAFYTANRILRFFKRRRYSGACRCAAANIETCALT